MKVCGRKYKILIVDDEQSILDMLKLQLEFEGYSVYTAGNAAEALDKLSYSPDIVLLDINMDGMNGLVYVSLFVILSLVRLFFLTARVSEQDKINGLMAGGDDYITKPFSVNELLARISAHLRREQRSHNKTKVNFQKILLLIILIEVFISKGIKLNCQIKEFEIIQLLSSNAGQVFDREKIYENIWGIDGNGDSVVIKEHIRKIRLKFNEFTDKGYITTVWGVGYKWEK